MCKAFVPTHICMHSYIHTYIHTHTHTYILARTHAHAQGLASAVALHGRGQAGGDEAQEGRGARGRGLEGEGGAKGDTLYLPIWGRGVLLVLVLLLLVFGCVMVV
jgi:hypothetical protein